MLKFAQFYNQYMKKIILPLIIAIALIGISPTITGRMIKEKINTTIITYLNALDPVSELFYTDVIKKIQKEYDITIIIRQLPDRTQQDNWDASKLIYCGKIWDEIFRKDEVIIEQTCLNNQEAEEKLEKEYYEALANNVYATPTTFIGQTKIVGYQNYETIIGLLKTQRP